MKKKITNRLIDETSPYLLQHAHNPVNWYPWGSEALQLSKTLNLPMLISIGYAACHWCHVMEKESFENEAIATLMNEHFINIKIDREERPDLDHIYMDAIQAMTGSGGWPLNVFLTPDCKPFYGGTYFPPVKAFNRASWTEVLQGVAIAWKERQNEIIAQAENLTDHLSKSNIKCEIDSAFHKQENNIFTKEQCQLMFQQIMKNADDVWGGFGKAPKFPQTFSIQYLLQYQHFTNNEIALKQALLSIDKMLEGGIYDQLAGGLARYSTDNEWLAPHFEKMLYDNALLIMVLCDAAKITGNKKYEAAVNKTIRFIQNELTDKHNGFYAALDADSEGVEGKFYVWQKDEIKNLLGKDADIFCAYFDVSENGNWEHQNILRILQPAEAFCKSLQIEQTAFEQLIKNAIDKLNSHRANRVRPALDDKIILSWNALMLTAISKAALVFKNKEYHALAVANFKFIQQSFVTATGSAEMYHTFKNGIAKYPAFLEDYAYYISACITMYELENDTTYLEIAKDCCSFVIENFSDEEGVYFYFTHKNQSDILVRKKEIYDGAIPSPNAVMADNLIKIGIIFADTNWQNRGIQMVTGLVNQITRYPGSFAVWGTILLQLAEGIKEIAVVGENYKKICDEIGSLYLPGSIVMGSKLENRHFPLLVDKPVSENTFIYLCKNYTCLTPFEHIADLKTALK